MTDQSDPNFYNRTSEVLNLCNKQLSDATDERIAASTAYIAARFSVWATANKALSATELENVRKQAIDTFANGYRQMLEFHFDDYVKNYNSYYNVKPGTFVRPAK